MARVLIHVEGETEENFVNAVLRPHLHTLGYQSVGARIIGNARQRDRRGGIRPWHSVHRDVVRHLKEDLGCLSTTMVDYYGLPAVGEGAWPGRRDANNQPFADKVRAVQGAMHEDICGRMPDGFDGRRFVPFVMMHEFEGLLFSDCSAFSKGIGKPELEEKLRAIRNQFNNPEEINDSPTTAPSKRVVDLVPDYQKPLFGALAAMDVGIDAICRECPNFRVWIDQLRSWVTPPNALTSIG